MCIYKQGMSCNGEKEEGIVWCVYKKRWIADENQQRWWLGVAEAGLFPGVNYYLSCWYKRSEFGIRAAIFFSAAALAGSFGGLLAAAIAQMGGVGGKPGWAWIFVSI